MPEPEDQKSILLIEESATLRYIVSTSIQKQGYEVLAVDKYVAGIELLQNSSGQFQGLIIGWPNYKFHTKARFLMKLLEKDEIKNLPVLLITNEAKPEILDWTIDRKLSSLVTWENYQEAIVALQKLMKPASDSVHPGEQAIESSDIRVLFVDDSPSILLCFQRLLERNGYEVDTATSVAQAYDMALENNYDIAIVDYFMPDEEGYVLCQKLRDNPETTGIRTAVITGTYLDEVIRECLQSGAVECMFKNEAEELFLARLKTMKHFIEVQRSVEKQRENLAGILESVGEGVYGVSNEGTITFVNPAALDVIGINSVNDVMGKKASDVFYSHSDTQDVTFDRLETAYRNSEELRGWETSFSDVSGKIIPVECTVYPLRQHGAINQESTGGSVIAFRDVSGRKMLEEKLRWQATHDHLTKLHNRRYFEEQLEVEIKKIRSIGHTSALVYLDLDRFKYINDTIGHEAGDHLLREVSRMLIAQLRKQDDIARIGGDEFAIILRKVNDQLALSLADRMRQCFDDYSFRHKGASHLVHASVGVAMIDSMNITAGDVLANADIACHIAKRSGRNQTHLYVHASDERNAMGSELGWSARIREALESNGFVLYYQPIMSMDDIDMNKLSAEDGLLWERYEEDPSNTRHFEALLRLRGDDGELYYPGSFVPTAERFNLMCKIDLWVLEHALNVLAKCEQANSRVKLSVNLSGHTLESDGSLDHILAIISQYGVSLETFIFEITETTAIANLEQANRFISELKKVGCRFSLDDFGSGFCSFSQLKTLPTDYVKIDGQFVKGMARDAGDRAIVTAMNDVAHSLGRFTVAEFVESPEILRLLKICGVDNVQGNYISQPLEKISFGNVIAMPGLTKK